MPKVLYPNCWLELDPEKLTKNTLSASQLGRLMDKMCALALRGDIKELKKIPFFIKWHSGVNK